MECRICPSNSGERRISPGQTIHEGEYWLVEHAYPVARKGWLVIVLKRHAEAVHELTPLEFAELAGLQSRATKLLHEMLQSQKEYISCYAEREHFYHIHFHVFAKPADLPAEQLGGGSFALLKVTEAEAVPGKEIAEFCRLLGERW
jgi:diadenosine tetraphosphate (Ap4A) HIT family hydrolase